MTRLVHIPALCCAAWLLGTLQALAAVPPPSETPAKIIVSGRTSTAVDIQIVKVGQEIPESAGDRSLPNTPGFEWYVSQHYALKSQMDEGFSRMILEVSELALPHWEALTGLEPPDQDTARMCIVYAKSADDVVKAIQGDLGFTWTVNGGGVTWWGSWAAYNYPSGTLQYHRRDLVIHENLHMLQGVALRNTAGPEGFTYGGAQHVYDPAKKQLTVQCFDRAPINNFTDQGLAALQKESIPLREMAEKHSGDGGGLGTVYTHFFWSDPDRYFRLCLWRDEYYRGRLRWESNVVLMEDIFGPLDALNAEWERWVKARRATFHHVDWGWEQEGNALKAYGFPWDKAYWSQMNIQYAPSEAAEYDPLRMDYPAEPMPPTVGPVKRGVEEPSVGYLADLSEGGWVGLGLGVTERNMCQVVIMDGKLVVEGKGMPIARQEFVLTERVQAAGKNDGNCYGVTIQIKQAELAVTVRAGAPPGPIAAMEVSLPVDEASRQQMMAQYMALIAKDGRPRITPFIDDARRPEPDLLKPAPANRWRFPAEPELLGLYRAAWRLKAKTPASLTRLKDAMLATVDEDPATQDTALALYQKSIAKVARDVLKGADSATAHAATADLMGISMRALIDRETTADQAAFTVELRSKGHSPARGEVLLAAEPEGTLGDLPPARPVEVGAGETQRVSWTWKAPADRTEMATVRVVAALESDVTEMRLTDTVTLRPSIPCWWVIGPFDNQGDGTVDTPQAIEQEPVDLGKAYAGKDGKEVRWQKSERSAEAKLSDEHVVDLAKLCGGETNVSAYAVTWIISPQEQDAVLAIGSDDGLVVWVNGE
ncbi:MAG: hypothetical protein FJX75_27785, partial [Armatimonadetes bacterium]|nr:hypothetical protein [Armatimonadota bacterium]